MAVDGVDGSGKTSFAANLVFEIQNRPVIVIPFWEDTYNYACGPTGSVARVTRSKGGRLGLAGCRCFLPGVFCVRP